MTFKMCHLTRQRNMILINWSELQVKNCSMTTNISLRKEKAQTNLPEVHTERPLTTFV